VGFLAVSPESAGDKNIAGVGQGTLVSTGFFLFVYLFMSQKSMTRPVVGFLSE